MSVVCTGDAKVMSCPAKMAGGILNGRCDAKACMAWREVEPGKGFCGLCSEPGCDLSKLRAASGLSMQLGRGDR